jgi:hypothetical protein
MRGTILTLVVGSAILAVIVAAPASGAIGPGSSPYVTDPTITSATYDPSTRVLSLTWTLVTATNGGSNLQLSGQNLRTSTAPSTTSGELTYPTYLWRSDDQTRLNSSLLVDFTNPLSPGTYYLQIADVGLVDYCMWADGCPPNATTTTPFTNKSPVASFTAAAATPPPPPQPPPPPLVVKCVVPKVVGKSLATAKSRLAASHCRTGRVGYRHSRLRRGLVYWQSRRPGARFARGTRIGLLVNLGR